MKGVNGTKVWLVGVSMLLLVGATFHLVRTVVSGDQQWPIAVGGWIIAVGIAVYMWRYQGKKQ